MLYWVGHLSRMGNHCLPKFILCNKLSSSHHDTRAPKKLFKNWLKKSFDTFRIDHCQWFILAENCVAWFLTTNHIVSFFENTYTATLKGKKCWRRSYKTMPSRLDPAISCSLQAFPTSALFAMNMPAGGMDQLLLDLYFMKPSYEWNE